jgi:diaminopimelate epimerase
MTRFYKLSGSGNDFLALAEPWETPSAERIRAWCRRGVSIGADGLFVLRRAAGGATMDYFNADGLPADLCLNGTRCAAQLAFHLGWAENTRGTIRLRTGAGDVAARRLDDGRTAVELPAPPEPPQALTVDLDGTAHSGWRILVGVPHFVLVLPGGPEGLETAPVRELGALIRHHPVFGDPGTNVNFVRFPAPDRMEIRTYERGVEDETLSCGTGCLAGAAVGLHLGIARLPLTVETQGGFALAVEGDPEAGSWFLSGDARVVAEGEILPGAAVRSGPPSWNRLAAFLQPAGAEDSR